MITLKQIDDGAKALRERQMEGKLTRKWEELPISSKRKWIAHSQAVLCAAFPKDEVQH